MRVTIQSVGVDINSNLETKIQRELQFSLSRVESHIPAISIDLNRVSNIRNHCDIHSRLTLEVLIQPNVVIEDKQANLEYVIDRVLHKASRTVERLIFKT